MKRLLFASVLVGCFVTVGCRDEIEGGVNVLSAQFVNGATVEVQNGVLAYRRLDRSTQAHTMLGVQLPVPPENRTTIITISVTQPEARAPFLPEHEVQENASLESIGPCSRIPRVLKTPDVDGPVRGVVELFDPESRLHLGYCLPTVGAAGSEYIPIQLRMSHRDSHGLTIEWVISDDQVASWSMVRDKVLQSVVIR